MTEVCDNCEGGFVLESIGQSLCPGCTEEADTRSIAQGMIDNLVIDYSSDMENCRGWAEDALELLSGDRVSKKNREAAIEALESLRKLSTDNAPDREDYRI